MLNSKAMLLMTAASGVCLASTAAAQQGTLPPAEVPDPVLATPDSAAASNEVPEGGFVDDSEIVVTGTLIRGVAPTGTNVIGLSSEDIVAIGATSSNDVLARIPQVSSAFNQSQSPGGSIALPIVRPNIRNLGASGGSTTLLLLNGFRMVGAGVLQTSPDPSVIPPAVIRRVEVIPDGGSSIYGSDAIGGVINFITRQAADGLEVSARYGFADDFWQVNADVTGGTSWGSGSAFVGYSFVEHDNILGGDRDFIHADNRPFGGSDFRIQNCDPGNVTVGGVVYGLPSLTPGANLCDENEIVDFYPREERHSVFGSLNQDIGENVTLDLTAYYSTRETLRQGISTTTEGSGTRGSGTITAANPYFRPVGSETSQTVAFSYGVPDLSPSEFTSLGITPTVSVEVGENWQVRAGVNYGRSTNEVRAFAINSSAQATALAGTTFTTALNPYDVDATNPAVLANIRDFEVSGESTQQIIQTRAVADGTLFTLPAGEVKLAFGVEHYEEQLDAAQGQGPRGNPVLFRSESERNVESLFGEVLIPLLGDASTIGSLDLSASARYDSYSDVGDTVNPKIGITYAPVPSLQFRGNYGTSFHAPSLADTGNAVDTRAQVIAVSPFRPASSPTSDLFRPTILVAGGNPDLQPETAETWSAGADWVPQGPLTGFRASVTYFNVAFEDAITVTPFFAANFFSSASYADLFIINPTLAQAQALTEGLRVENAPSIASLYAGATTPFVIIDARRQNLGSVKVDGVDFNLSYERETGFGSINAGIAGTYTLNRETQATAGAAVVDELESGNRRLGLVGTLGANAGDFTGLVTVNHSGGYPVLNVVNQTRVDSFTTVNLFLQHDLSSLGGFGEDLSATVNVDNLFNQDPPYFNGVSGYANGSTLGRLVTFGIRKAF